jgi:hypothetical protein
METLYLSAKDTRTAEIAAQVISVIEQAHAKNPLDVKFL